MKNCPEDRNNAEYMNIAHEQIQTSKTMEKNQDTQINNNNNNNNSTTTISNNNKTTTTDRKSVV